MNNNMPINLGDLTKPATVLIEKISGAIGGILKPYQIKRIAKAEAEADVIRALAKIKISKMQRRALRRFVEEETKKQANIEAVTAKAIPHLRQEAHPENIEDDWITNFFDKCRLISDSQMQSLWSRVLAGEANFPGSYSKRTVNFMSTLDKRDAGLFTKLCTFGWVIGEFSPLIYDFEDEIYKKHEITFNTLKHLDSIGLIQFETLTRYSRGGLPKQPVVHYYGAPTVLDFLNKESNNEVDIGHVLLTSIGNELAPICGSYSIVDRTLQKVKSSISN
jgi:hypothetical protein